MLIMALNSAPVLCLLYSVSKVPSLLILPGFASNSPSALAPKRNPNFPSDGIARIPCTPLHGKKPSPFICL